MWFNSSCSGSHDYRSVFFPDVEAEKCVIILLVSCYTPLDHWEVQGGGIKNIGSRYMKETICTSFD